MVQPFELVAVTVTTPGPRFAIEDVVAELDHKYVTGPDVPVTVAVAVPSFRPQVASVLLMLTFIGEGETIVKYEDEEHPFGSVVVNV